MAESGSTQHRIQGDFWRRIVNTRAVRLHPSGCSSPACTTALQGSHYQSVCCFWQDTLGWFTLIPINLPLSTLLSSAVFFEHT